MAILIFHLHSVPEEEAEDIRALLTSHSIAFFETQPSNWGVSHGAMWVESQEEALAARRCIDSYQAARAANARSTAVRVTLLDTLRQSPGRFVIVLLGILLVLLLTALPAWLLR
ncbi:MAG: DUF6164 family protein [Lysobacteraceae bacterium]